MKFSWTDEGSNSGPVTGLNRSAVAGETEGTITPQDLIWGMDNDMYTVVSGAFTALDGTERQAVLDARQAVADAQAQAIVDMQARIALLEAETTGDGLNEVTPEQVDTYLDNQYDPTDFDAAPDNVALKVAIRELFINNKAVVRKIAMRVLKLSEIANR